MFRHLKPSLFLRRVVTGATAIAATTSTGRATLCADGVTSSQGISRPFTQRRVYATKSKDYYKTLGVDRNADLQTIKKAYRKRALETHPDQGGNKEEFAEVAEAYEVLSNTEKKNLYDQYGSEAANNPNMASGFAGGRSAEDIFAEFFRGSMGMGGFGDMFRGNAGANRGPPTVEPIEVRLRLTLEEVYTGVTKTIRVTRPQICSECNGFGTKSKTEKPKCSHCNGQGHVVQQHRMGPGMIQQSISECPNCHGTGTLAKPDDQCHKCRGKGYRNVAQDVAVNVPAGIPSNVTMIVRGEGGSIPGAQDGDLHIHVEVSPHRLFQRRGDDLIVRKEVSLAEALLGVSIPLKLLDGRVVNVETPAESVLKHNGVIKLTGEGLSSNTSGRGDIYVFIQLKMPDKLSSEQKDYIKKALGSPSLDANSSQGNTVKARVLRESQEQLEEQKRGVWEARESGKGAESDRRRRSSGQRGGQHVEQCTAQ
ncbi:unnamed protein product [Phytomonas sp. Hart1]|nr:unnamed protein product [Phytomonas sp. Hart1]|eukprot:CCW68885.1 unnamed protein product [Phytomonas sp. isolate Hart1]